MSYPQQTEQAQYGAPAHDSSNGTTEAPSTKDSGMAAADQGKHAAGDVAHTATERAQDVKDEAVRQTRDLVGEARHQVTQQAGQQQQSLVANLRSLSSELGAMAHHGGESGMATDLVQQAQQRLSGFADWLEHREPGDVVDEARIFARRRPGTFLVAALAAGVVAGRLTRGAVEVHTGNGPGSGTDGGVDQPTQAMPAYPTPAAEPPLGHQPPSVDAPTYGAPTYGEPTYGEPTYGGRP